MLRVELPLSSVIGGPWPVIVKLQDTISDSDSTPLLPFVSMNPSIDNVPVLSACISLRLPATRRGRRRSRFPITSLSYLDLQLSPKIKDEGHALFRLQLMDFKRGCSPAACTNTAAKKRDFGTSL